MTKDRNHTTLFHEDSDVGDDAGGTIGTVANQRGIGSVILPMNDGWIKLPRAIVDMWMFRNGDYLKIWIYLLCTANYRPSKANVGGEFMTIERGQVLTSIRSLAKATGTTEKQVRTFLLLGHKSGTIRAKKGTGATVVTIIDYDGLEGRSDSEGHTKGTARAHEGHYHKKEEGRKKNYTITDTIDRGATLSRSRPRSQDEATAYFVEIGSTPEEGATFWDHFESNGWKVGGKTAMKNWQSAAKNWVRRNNTNQRANNGKRSKGERSVAAGTPDSLFRLARLERPDRRGGIGALELDSSNGRTLGIGPPNDNRSEPAQLLLGRIDGNEL